MTTSTQTDLSGFFNRFRGDLLKPLSGANRARKWALLVALYGEYFGPDAMAQPEEGVPRKQIISAIENHILAQSAWEAEDGGELITDSRIRAGNILQAFLDAGWLRDTTRGVRKFIDMPEYEAHFLELLMKFAEDGPAKIGCDVQTILSCLRDVKADPRANAQSMPTVARLSRDMVATLNNTRVKARELIVRLGDRASTADYVSGFFGDYVTSLFISDYRELRMRNHPLQHRHEILGILADLRDNDEAREQLTQGYRDMLPGRSDVDIEIAVRRDLERLRRFEDVEDHLDRLDSGVAKATRQAISFISYRLRSRGVTEQYLAQSAAAVVGAEGIGIAEIDTPWGVGPMFKDSDLREPRIPKPPAKRSPIPKSEPTLEELALWSLQRDMAQNRSVTPGDLKDFVMTKLSGRDSLTSDEFSINTVKEMVMYEALSRIALIRTHRPPGGAEPPISTGTQWMKVELIHDRRSDNDVLNSPAFRITLEKSS